MIHVRCWLDLCQLLKIYLQTVGWKAAFWDNVSLSPLGPQGSSAAEPQAETCHGHLGRARIGRDARGTKSSRVTKSLGISSTMCRSHRLGRRGRARRSRNHCRAMAVPAMLGHGRDARGTKSSRVTKSLGISSTVPSDWEKTMVEGGKGFSPARLIDSPTRISPPGPPRNGDLPSRLKTF
jgi:hypothetical protein